MTYRDPVCGKRMNRNKAHIVVEHRGVEYYICCPECQSAFERDPEQYVKHESKSRRRARSTG